MARLNRYRSPKARARRNRALVFRFILAVCVVLFIICGAAALLLIPAFMVREVRVAGAENSVLEAHVRAIAERESSRSLLFLFSRRNTFLYPTGAIVRAVQTELPEVARVEARHDDIHSVRITLETRQPFALWCGDIVPLPGDPPGDCYTIDAGGIVYAHADELPSVIGAEASSTAPVYFYGALGEGGPLGAQFLTPERFERLRAFTELLSERGIPPASSVTMDDIQGEIVLRSGVRVLYTERDNADDIMHRLTLLLHSSEIDPTTLEYIDLRFGNKVFVKSQHMQDAEPVAAP